MSIKPERKEYDRRPVSTGRRIFGRVANKNFTTMIRKLKSGQYRIYSRKVDPKTHKRKNLGTFDSMEAAKKHEREIQYFKHH